VLKPSELNSLRAIPMAAHGAEARALNGVFHVEPSRFQLNHELNQS
jgi:hypothetical protein